MHYVYLDEATFGDTGQYSGYGCLVTDYKIGPEIIESALNALREDPDIRSADCIKQDTRTLESGYFHASEDSKNAHSHLCNAINAYVVGRFNSYFFKKKKNAFKDTSEAYSLASKLAVTRVFSETDEVTFVFEERDDLTESLIRSWWSELWKDLLTVQELAIFKATYYPKLNFNIGGKQEPGLQIVDFLLWAGSRKRLREKCPWIDRIETSIRTEIKPANDSWGGLSIDINIRKIPKLYHYGIEDSSTDPRYNTEEMLWQYLIHVQKAINVVYNSGKRQAVEHFWEDIEYLYINRTRDRSPDFIEKLATCFLKLFDNYPLIKEGTPAEDKAFWLTCRRKMAFALHTDVLGGRLFAIKLHDMRSHLIDKEINLLELH